MSSWSGSASAVADPETGARLMDAIREVKACGQEVHGESFKRVPAGYGEVPEERRRLLLFGARFTGGVIAAGPWIHTAEALERPLAVWKASLPIHAWLVESMAGA